MLWCEQFVLRCGLWPQLGFDYEHCVVCFCLSLLLCLLFLQEFSFFSFSSSLAAWFTSGLLIGKGAPCRTCLLLFQSLSSFSVLFFDFLIFWRLGLPFFFSQHHFFLSLLFHQFCFSEEEWWVSTFRSEIQELNVSPLLSSTLHSVSFSHTRTLLLTPSYWRSLRFSFALSISLSFSSFVSLFLSLVLLHRFRFSVISKNRDMKDEEIAMTNEKENENRFFFLGLVL